jgi:WD40 repeat protein
VAQEAKTLRGHSAHITCLDFSPDESRLITGSRDGTARIWRTATGEQLAVLPHAGIVNAAHFSPDGRSIVTADDTSGAMTVWDAGTGERLRSIRASAPIAVPLFTPDDQHVVGISGESRIVRWNATTWAVEQDAETGVPLGRMSAITPDGSTLVTANDSGVVRFWGLSTLRERGSSPEHKSLVSSIRFSPDGLVMATGSFDGSVRLWVGAPARSRRCSRAIRDGLGRSHSLPTAGGSPREATTGPSRSGTSPTSRSSCRSSVTETW